MTASLPTFSVIVPSHNRAAQLAECLESLAALDYPRSRFEVIIVDDASPQPLQPVCDAWAERVTVRCIARNQCGGPAAARNTGLEVASGEFVAFTADDCRVHRDWLKAFVPAVAKDHPTAAGGRIENGLPANVYSSSTDLLIRYLYRYYNPSRDRARFFTPNNMAFPTARLRELRGFLPAFVTGEDRELCERWLDAGCRLVSASDAVVHHFHPLGLVSFCQLHYRYGEGSARYRRRAAQRHAAAGKLEPISFYLDLMTHPMREVRGARGVKLSALLGVSQIANALGFIRQTCRHSNNVDSVHSETTQSNLVLDKVKGT